MSTGEVAEVPTIELEHAAPAEVLLTESEARALTAKIKAYAGTLWKLIDDAHRGQAWKPLGYSSFAEYLRVEFDISRSRGYQFIDHARKMYELAAAAGLEVSTMVDILGERVTRTLDVESATAAIAAALADAPDADDEQRIDIVTEQTTKVTTTQSVNAGTGEALPPQSPTDAPVPPAGEPVDEAPGDRCPGPGAGEQQEGSAAAPEEGGGSPSPAPSDDLDDAPLSPAMQRLKFAGTATRALGVVRERLLPLDPDDVMAAIPTDERAMWASLSRDLRAYCDRIDAALTPNLRSVQ